MIRNKNKDKDKDKDKAKIIQLPPRSKFLI